MKYFISDHHWGHKAVIRMSNRPFKDIFEMNQYMVNQWNDVVGEDDEVYYLGDFMYKMNPNTFVNHILNKLNGKIYLIIGNHDRRYLKKYTDRLEWIREVEYMRYDYELLNYRPISIVDVIEMFKDRDIKRILSKNI